MSVPPDERLPARRVLSHLGVMAAVAAVMGVVVAGLAIPFAGVLGIATRDVARSMDSLPTELKAEPLAQKTKILDANGNVIASLYDENRINVPLRQISRTMVKAVVAIEDYRYYQHGALDLKGTLRALVTNQANDGVVQGGSSITQQMVKLTLLSQADTAKERRAAIDDTYARKIRELRYAIAFEENYSKDWILERYLNIAYFGDGAYGVQAAARHYFSKNAKDLDLRESAMLAGLVKNPTGYDPTNNADTALQRRNTVLDRMAQLNVITQKKAAKTKEMNLGLDLTRSRNGCVFSRAPFFCDYVINVLMSDRSLGKTMEDRRQLLRSGGLTIRTTIDLRMQDAADASVRSHVYPENQAIGGLAMVEPGTGNVRALAQSRPMGRDRNQGQTYLNYVVPKRYGDSNGFHAGSTFKAFVLAAALEMGVPPETSIDSPEQISVDLNEFETCGGPYASTEVWEPSNSTDSGTMTLYTGTQLSVNTFFVQLEMITGLCRPYKLAKSMGIDLTDPTTERTPSFTLGSVDTSPLEMAEAYATFAARGLHCSARPVTAIEDPGGNLIKEYPERCDQVLPEAAADTVNDILKGVMEPGGFGQNIATSQQSAGKTGTTQDGRSVWFVGYTPNLATAAMIAGADRDGRWLRLAGQTIGGTYISAASGSGVAGPMWGEAMRAIEPILDDETFTAPDLSELLGDLTTIPSTGGMSEESAISTLEAAGFNPVVSSSLRNSDYSYGTVAYTNPSSGTSMPEGSIVTIYLSNGVSPTPPPPPPSSGGGGNDGGNDGGGNDGGGGGNRGGNRGGNGGDNGGGNGNGGGRG